MKERLIELLKNFADGTYTSNGIIVDGTKVDDVADYLIANGVLCPPCKVGDTVVMNELKELMLSNLTEIGYYDIVNERQNSVDVKKIVDIVCDIIADYLKGGAE